MQELYDIVNLVNSGRVFPIKKFEEEGLEGTKLYQLYEGICSGSFTSDDDAAQQLYGADASDKRYLMLRKNLTDRLVQTLVQYDYSKRFSVRVNEKIGCTRSSLAAMVLLAAGAGESGGHLLERILRKAEQYHFTGIRVQCLQTLREKASLQGDAKRYEEYDQALKEALALQQAELEAEEMCQRIEIHYTRSVAEQPHLAQTADTFLQRLRELKTKYSSYELDVNTFRVRLLLLQIRHEYQEALKVCREAVSYYHKHPNFGSKGRQAEFMTAAMNCCLRLRDYDQALEYGAQCSELFVEGKYNWYITQRMMVLLSLHTGDFERALSIYIHALSHRGFEELPELQRDRWLIYGAYLHLILEQGWVTTSLANRRKLNKLAQPADVWQQIATLARDKKGMRITVLLLEALSLTHGGDEQGIQTRLKLLQRYIKKHEGDVEYARTTEFLHMLRTFARNGFNGQKAWTKARKYYNALLAQPRSTEHFVEGVEVIPYELLWQWLTGNEAAPAK